jgi:sugar (glycoside-pentoside-hexuronide) transporter
MKTVTSDKRNLWLFPVGTVGRDMIYSLFTNYIFTYILFTRNLTAAQLTAVTAIMVGARVFDALNDPVMGNIIERTRTRWGKFKPWLVIGILSTSVVVYLAFNTALQGWSFIAFFGVIYFMYSITFTMHDISYWGMVSALSSDAHMRDALTSRTNLFAGIGNVIASIMIPMLTTGSGAIGGSAATAYGRVALVICLLAPLFLCATIFGVRERRDYNNKPVPPVSFKKILGTITGNPQILWISLIFLLQQMGNDVVLGGLGSTYIYFAFGYEGGLYSLFNTIGLAASALLMIFYPVLTRRWRRKELMNRLMLLSAVGYAVMLIAGLAPGSGMVKFWILVVGYMLSNLGQYGFYLIMMISLINTVEYNEYLHGERDEAIITSLRPFFTKMASAIVVALTSGTYLLFGVTDYTNRISALERSASLGEITESAKLTQIDAIITSVQAGQSRGLLLCMVVLPFVLMYASFVLYKKHYILDEDKYAEICAALEERRAEEE